MVNSPFVFQGECRTTPRKYISFWVCNVCGSGVCVEAFQPYLPDHDKKALNFSTFYPQPETPQAPDGTPEGIADAFLAAKFNAKAEMKGAWDAAAIMARKCIELACLEFGASGGNLVNKINSLAEKGILTSAMAAWAHEIRAIGNQGAHKESVSQEDAQEAVYFAEMLFTYLYKLPKMIEERRNKKT